MKAKTKYFLIGGSVLITMVALFFLFKPESDIDKAVKSLNAQNYDMAISKLKEIIYDDETDYQAKGLLLYAQARKYFEENEINSFKKAMNVSFVNLLQIKKLIYQMKLSEKGLLTGDEKKEYVKNSKDLRKQFMGYSIPTEDMFEIEKIFELVCEVGVDELRLSQGDDIDQALYAFLLAGNSFFGNKESGEKLIKLAKMNEDAQPLFFICGSNISESLKKEIKNDESLVSKYAKYLFIQVAMKDKIGELFEKHNKMRSAIKELIEKEPTNYSSVAPRIVFKNAEIFYEKGLFDDYLQYSEINKNVGVDVSIYLYEDNSFVASYIFDPRSNKYITKFYCLVETELNEINFDNKFLEFSSKDYPITIEEYDEKTQILKLASHKKVKKTGIRTEERYNSQKYYSSWYGYSGGYDYVQVPYEYEDIENDIKTYSLNKDKAKLMPETEVSGDI